MNLLDYDPQELDDLLEKLCEQTLSDAEAARLNEIVVASRLARQRYLSYANLHTALYWDRADRAAFQEYEVNPLHGQESLQGFQLPPDDEPDEPEPLTAPNIPMPPPLQPPSRRALWWVSSAAAAVVLVASLVAALLIRGGSPPQPSQQARRVPTPATNPNVNAAPAVTRPSVPQPPVVALVTASVNAKWDDAAVATAAGARIRAGRRLTLTRGFAELRFGNGAKVVVEGPAAFVTDSKSAMSLDSGRLVATASGAASRGFAVRTPGAKVVDLGTQFGVAVDPAGATEVQVFDGQVEAAPIDGAAAATRPSLLKAGDAGRVTSTGVSVTPDAAQPQRFVRQLPRSATPIDVVDLVAGGDGTTGRRGRAIDRRTGQPGVFPPISTYKSDGPDYRPVIGLPVIDGVFVPNGLTKVNAAGDTFNFPPTSGDANNHIWAGGEVPTLGQHRVDARVGDVDYTAPGHGLLFLHSNAGLTIDLAAIRRLYPGWSPSRFRCTVLHSIVAGAPEARKALTDVFVLVDGKERFARRRFAVQDKPIAMDVPLSAEDRYLTLAVTDGGDSVGWDWIIWGDPMLDLAAVDEASGDGK